MSLIGTPEQPAGRIKEEANRRLEAIDIATRVRDEEAASELA
jgi:hypothetical protein